MGAAGVFVWKYTPDTVEDKNRYGEKTGSTHDHPGTFIGKIVLAVAALGFLITTIACSTHTVAQRQVGIVKNFAGQITGTTGNGVVFTMPYSSVSTENVGLQRENFILDQSNSAVSSDQQPIYADLTLNYHLTADTVLNLYKTVGPNWKAILIDSRVLQDFKEVTATFTAQEITTHREQLRAATKLRLESELSKHDITVDDFFVTNLDYTQTYKDAINNKNVQVQQALQAQAKVAQARAEAAQEVATATGDAQAIRLKGKALHDNPEVLQLEAIDKLNPNASVIICTGTGSGNCPSFLPASAATTPVPGK